MGTRGMVTGIIAVAMLLTGCAATPGPGTTSNTAVDAATPSGSSSASSGAATLVDPAAFPLPTDEVSQGMKGVMFIAGGGGLQCAIFDPLAAGNTFAKPPEFGCVVSVEGYPYPPIVGGPSDTANAFLSRSHQTATATTVTDATYSGDRPAPALLGGQSIAWSTVTCTAIAADEVRCVDAASGHGMRVSVRDFQLF